jgi:hypothetical protein
MATSPSSGRRGMRATRKSKNPPLEYDGTRLSRELEEIRQRELELKREHEEIQRRVADLPRQIEERERKQRELIRLRAVSTATTADGFSRPRDKRHSVSRTGSPSRRMTRPEERSARSQFILLCVIFAGILFLLFKSLPR